MSVHAPQQPRYAPMRQLPVAVVHPRVGRRLLGHLLDTLIVLAPGGVVFLLTENLVLAGVISLELVLFQIVSEARCGATLGKWFLGIRAAKTNSLYAPGLARASVRAFMLGLGHLVAGVGQFVMIGAAATDREGGQGWHDKPARTTVLDVRAGLQPSSFAAVATPTAKVAPADAAASGGRPTAPRPPVTGAAAPGPARPPATQAAVPSAAARVAAHEGPPDPAGATRRPDAPQAAPGEATRSPGDHAPLGGTPAGPAAPSRPAPVDSAARPATIHLLGEAMEPILIAGTVFVGRAPTASGNEAATAVAISDEHRSLSRTHARLDVRGGQLVVTDLGSANGTFLVAPDGSAQRLEPNRSTPVPTGFSLALGSKLFTIRAA